MGRLVGVVLRKDDILKLYAASDSEAQIALMNEWMPSGWPGFQPLGCGLTIRGTVYMKTGVKPSQGSQ